MFIDTIQVNYRAVSSVNINVMQNMIAVAGVDFNDTIMSVQLADGVTGVEIPIPIFDVSLGVWSLKLRVVRCGRV